jgi:hypothetical protein
VAKHHRYTSVMASSNRARHALPVLVSILVIVIVPMHAQEVDVDTLVRREATSIGEQWLGPRSLAIDDRIVDTPVWQGRGAMKIEAQQARQIIRGWWPARIADAHARKIVDGFTNYLAALISERVFDRRYLREAHSVESIGYFGGHFVWSFPPLRLPRQAISGRDHYAAVFSALERWLGVPTLQAAMFEVAHLPEARLTGAEIRKTISNAAGQDLSWAFDAAETDVNYTVDALTDKSVTVSRRGAGMFSGRTNARVGDFDSGDAVRVRVVFADGTAATATWDGRDQTRTFTFQGPSTAVAAYLDPDRIVTLDRNRLDNAIVMASPTNVPVRKWTARWLVWLQHTMLSYGFLA